MTTTKAYIIELLNNVKPNMTAVNYYRDNCSIYLLHRHTFIYIKLYFKFILLLFADSSCLSHLVNVKVQKIYGPAYGL